MKGKSCVYGNNSSNKLSAEWLQGEEAACLAVTHWDLSVMSHAIGHGALTESRRKQQVWWVSIKTGV